MLISDGLCISAYGEGPRIGHADVPVVLTPTSSPPSQWQWTPLYDAEYEAPTGYPFHIHMYPFMFQATDGDVFFASSHYMAPYVAGDMLSRKLDVPTQSWSVVAQMPEISSGLWFKGGSAVMYGPDLVMTAGGGLPLAGNNFGACAPSPVSTGLTKSGCSTTRRSGRDSPTCLTRGSTITLLHCQTEKYWRWGELLAEPRAASNAVANLPRAIRTSTTR
jgi:hypothetical protein